MSTSTDTTTAKQATIVRTATGEILTAEIKTSRHAEFVGNNGGALYADLAQAEDFLANFEVTEDTTFSKPSKLVVNGLPVYLPNGHVAAAAAEKASPAVEVEVVVTETKKERTNRLARERRAAKKANV